VLYACLSISKLYEKNIEVVQSFDSPNRVSIFFVLSVFEKPNIVSVSFVGGYSWKFCLPFRSQLEFLIYGISFKGS